MVKLAIHSFVFVFLTLLTQIGGLAYFLVILTKRLFARPGVIISGVLFLFAYGLISFATQKLAPFVGRYPINCFDKSGAFYVANPLYCVFHRHYATGKVLKLLEASADAVEKKYPGSRLLVLDANFPFLDGFPLLPHLSHDDGRKVDLAFYYQDRDGEYLPGEMKSPIGYWGFEAPETGAELPCSKVDHWITLRWDMGVLQGLWPDHRIEPDRTAMLLNWLVTDGQNYGLEKILLEPHLKQRLGIENDLVRFQGCRAARHDDHIHVQLVK